MKTLLLFDVDGVLIHASGYRKALQATINHFAALMGQPPMALSESEIAVFEASGLTNEWDTVAFAVGALLSAALTKKPDCLRPSFEATLEAIRQAAFSLPRPDFVGLVREVAQRNVNGDAPTRSCLALLRERSHASIHPLLHLLLEDVYSIETPTTQVQQTHTLGSTKFKLIYGQDAPLVVEESYLLKYDTPLLTAENKEILLHWQQHANHGITIFTARPSLPPVGAEADASGYAPEGDFALELLGFAGRLPLIGMGRMDWLARRYGRHVADYVKPAPVQALAAIGAAVTGEEKQALEAAAAFFEENKLIAPLDNLRHTRLDIVVFEDAVGGILATRLAVEKLRTAGLNVSFRGIGVSPETTKQEALAQVAHHVVPTINAGIELVI